MASFSKESILLARVSFSFFKELHSSESFTLFWSSAWYLLDS